MTNKQMCEAPSFYQIQVRGTLDESWSDWFDGFSVPDKMVRPSWQGKQ